MIIKIPDLQEATNSSSTTGKEAYLLLEDQIFIGILSALILLILVLNGFVALAISCHRALRTGSNIPILSLALADICIALFVIPGHISGRFSEDYLGNLLCIACSYASYASMAATVFSLAVISLTRLRAVAFPLKPKLTGRQAGVIVATLWLPALVYGLRGGLTFSLTEIVLETQGNGALITRVICGVDAINMIQTSALAALDFLIIFLLPAMVISVSYLALLYSLSKHHAEVGLNLQEMNGNSSSINNHRHSKQHHSSRKNRKVVRKSIFVISLFLLCHLPEHAMRVYVSRDASLMSESIHLMMAFHVISFINSVLNPIFYGLMNPKIREGFNAVIGKCFCRRSPHQFHSGTFG